MSDTMRVLFVPEPRAVYDTCHRFPVLRPTSACKYPGYCAEIIYLIAKSLGIEIEPVTMDVEEGHVDYGNNVDGNWTGVLGAIQRGDVDTACLLYQQSYFRRKTFNFSDLVYMTQTSLAVRRRDDAITSGMWEIFQSYSSYTWCAMGISFAIHIILFIFIARTEVVLNLRQKCKPVEIVWQLVTMQLVRPEKTGFYSKAGRLALFVFALTQCMLLLGLYQTYILSAIIRPPDLRPFKNVNAMLNNFATNNFRFVSYYPGHWYWDATFRSPVSDFQSKSIRDGMDAWPIESVSSVREALDRVNEGNLVLISQTDDYASSYLSYKYCDIIFIWEGLPEMSAHFVFRQDNPLIHKFNEAIARESIPIMRIVRKYFSSSDAGREQACGRSREPGQARDPRPIGIVPYFGLCLVVVAGAALGILAFIVEIASNGRRSPRPR